MFRRVSNVVRFFSEVKQPIYVISFAVGVLASHGVPTFGFGKVLSNMGVEPTFDEESWLGPWVYSCPPGIFVDVGANKGEWVKRLLDKGRTVVAFEPNPQMKRFAPASESLDWISVALGDKEGIATLNLQVNPGMNSIRQMGNVALGHIQVPVRTLDSYYLFRVGGIKIDTEGYEIPVLEGARETIALYKPRLIIEVHGDFAKEQVRIEEWLKGIGYSSRVIHIRKGQPHIVADAKGLSTD